MIADYAIREKLAHFLTGGLSLDQFEDWLVQKSWNMHRDSDDQSQKLASAIELRLAEHSNGHLSEPELRAELLGFVTKYVVRLVFNGKMFIDCPDYPFVSMSSSNEPIKQMAFQVAFPGKQIPLEASQFAGTSPVVVYA